MGNLVCPICGEQLMLSDFFNFVNIGQPDTNKDCYVCPNQHVFRGVNDITRVMKEIADGKIYDPAQGDLTPGVDD